MVMQWTVNPPPSGTPGSIPGYSTKVISSSLQGPTMKTLLQNRFTTKWWNYTKPIEQEKLQELYECVQLAPSKNGDYCFEIYAFGDTAEANEFKQWLYWENTYCLDTVRGKPGPGLRRYNGQVIAPLVLMWVATDNHTDTRHDCIVSSTVAMLSAESLGLQTGFNGCIGETEIANKLNITGKPIMTLGIGYAGEFDNEEKRKVFDDNGNHVGSDYANIPPGMSSHTRKNRPAVEKLFKTI